MPASQHQKPKSDIEISQSATKRPILDIAKEKLGIAAENLEPYGHYKAKISMDFIKSLQGKPDGKLILVSAISPSLPAIPLGSLAGSGLASKIFSCLPSSVVQAPGAGLQPRIRRSICSHGLPQSILALPGPHLPS